MHDHLAAIEDIRHELHEQREQTKRAVGIMYELFSLTTIALNAELGQDDKTASEELRAHLGTIAAEATRLSDLVHEFLETKHQLEPFDAARIDALCERLRPPTLLGRVLHHLPGFRRG